jgi:hypothetical protein
MQKMETQWKLNLMMRMRPSPERLSIIKLARTACKKRGWHYSTCIQFTTPFPFIYARGLALAYGFVVYNVILQIHEGGGYSQKFNAPV